MKSSQLQLRISAPDKRSLKRASNLLGQTISEFVLNRALRGLSKESRFDELISSLETEQDISFTLAAINDQLTQMSSGELRQLTERPRSLGKTLFAQSYVAAMLEQACHSKHCKIPDWIAQVPAMPAPWFATSIKSLRMHLLLCSPVPFRRRNLFVDTSLGGRA